jgi:hypothetical protein
LENENASKLKQYASRSKDIEKEDDVTEERK